MKLNIFKKIKYLIQRAKRGYSDRDLWCLHGYIARLMSSALKDFKKNLHGYPMDLTEERWDRILDIMQDGFEATLKGDEVEFENLEQYVADCRKLEKIQHRGLKLFVKYFNDLWD